MTWAQLSGFSVRIGGGLDYDLTFLNLVVIHITLEISVNTNNSGCVIQLNLSGTVAPQFSIHVDMARTGENYNVSITYAGTIDENDYLIVELVPDNTATYTIETGNIIYKNS